MDKLFKAVFQMTCRYNMEINMLEQVKSWKQCLLRMFANKLEVIVLL